MASLADIEFRYSGGAGNSDPLASLGGVISATRKGSQSVGTPSNIGGVTPLYAALNPEGAGTLSYFNATNTLTWTPFSASAGAPVDVSSDGTYAILGSVGYIVVSVVSASLPGSDQTDALTVANITEALFDNVSGADATSGKISYRCEYVFNVNGSDTINNVRVYIGQQPTGADSLDVGLDPAGIGNGTTTGVATTIPNETTAPGGVIFTQPSDVAGAIAIGNLPPNSGQAVWVRRTVPSNVSVPTPNDVSQLVYPVEL